MTTHEKYRELREAAGVSVRELARMLDISPTYISQVETGKEPRGYSRSTTMKMICALKPHPSVARELLEEWRAFHASEVAAIEEFICAIEDEWSARSAPICTECAKREGLVWPKDKPVTDAEGICSVCGEQRGVSPRREWK